MRAALRRMIWNPGDDTDLNEGGENADTVEVDGGGGADTLLGSNGIDTLLGGAGDDFVLELDGEKRRLPRAKLAKLKRGVAKH